MGNTRGITAINYIAYLKEQTTAEQFEQIKSKLTPNELHSLFGGIILPMHYVDYQAIMHLLLAADSIIGNNDTKLLFQCSYDNQIKNFNTIYKIMLPLFSPAYLMKKASKLWATYHDTGNLAVEKITDNKLKLILNDYPDIPEYHAPEIEGAYHALMDMAKVSHVKIVHTHCVNKGDPNCTWELSWH